MLFAILTSLDVGMWLGWLTSKFGSRDTIKERLIFGSRAAVTFPIIDKELEKMTCSSTKLQREAAIYAAKGIRYLVSSRAFELLLLKIVHDNMTKSVSYQKVRLSV
jgi:hypothetical protein